MDNTPRRSSTFPPIPLDVYGHMMDTPGHDLFAFSFSRLKILSRRGGGGCYTEIAAAILFSDLILFLLCEALCAAFHVMKGAIQFKFIVMLGLRPR